MKKKYIHLFVSVLLFLFVGFNTIQVFSEEQNINTATEVKSGVGITFNDDTSSSLDNTDKENSSIGEKQLPKTGENNSRMIYFTGIVFIAASISFYIYKRNKVDNN
ncbi:hypothetical protein YS9_3346 [Enterococcus sp. C1]|uniref:LPXTG cell wall anchor domain-containing protein n=1 Tax=Enterococcus sp. C1 TaxID=1182762 RepID=UPI0002721937|nr:LPXTG cell wall anchor domain-containing protein [Enterococcus sp. C1]EJF48099.1 hypothetical protein YS9_3346 [Enterococcus sp. C1]